MVYSIMVDSKNKNNGRLTSLIRKRGVCPFDSNLWEINVSFKIRGGVGVILICFRKCECSVTLGGVLIWI